MRAPLNTYLALDSSGEAENTYLALVSSGASGEVDEERQVALLVQVVHHLLLHVHRLPSAGGTHKQQRPDKDTQRVFSIGLFDSALK